MARIAARAPYYITQHVETLLVKLKIYPAGGTLPTAWQYNIVKNSYKAGISEDLRINISPFMRDFFDHTFDSLPTAPQVPSGDYELNVVVEVNGVEETHTAYDGIIVPTNDAYLGTRKDHKRIVLPQDGSSSPLGYFSFSATATASLVYTTNTGIQETLAVTVDPTRLIQIAPLIPPGMDITGATSVTVKANTSSMVELWSMTFEIDCTFQTDETIGFINWYGVWEYIFIKGSVKYDFKGEESEYTSFSTGGIEQYNNNLRVGVTVNTGWVDYGFYQTLEGLVISETTVYYSGGPWSTYVVLTSRSIPRQNRRVDKMINYTLTFKAAHKLIPIV